MPTLPVILDFLEPAVVEFLEKPAGEYDQADQVFRYNQAVMAGTSRTQSYQNSTTAPSVITGCEDYDDQYVTTPD